VVVVVFFGFCLIVWGLCFVVALFLGVWLWLLGLLHSVVCGSMLVWLQLDCVFKVFDWAILLLVVDCL
jgi:hypothetical protein